MLLIASMVDASERQEKKKKGKMNFVISSTSAYFSKLKSLNNPENLSWSTYLMQEEFNRNSKRFVPIAQTN